MNPNQSKFLTRDVEASVVPVGTKVTLQKGGQAYVTQSLGGTFTVVVNGNMFRIDGKDADALGLEIKSAPATLRTEFAKGKTKADVEKMFGQVHEMVTTGKIQGDVGKLAVFAGVYKFPTRVKCAILSWQAVMAALKGDAKPVTTESEAA